MTWWFWVIAIVLILGVTTVILYNFRGRNDRPYAPPRKDQNNFNNNENKQPHPKKEESHENAPREDSRGLNQ